MRALDLVAMTWSAVAAGRLRARLTALGIAVGIAAVVLLTAIGRGVHGFVLGEFVRFGTNVISITPGQTQTHGVPGGMIGNVRPLLPADAEALRRTPQVLGVVPIVSGNAQIEARGRKRRVTVFGCSADAPLVWAFDVTAGRFLPAEEGAPRALAVLGHRARAELFGGENPLGARLTIAGERYTVVGVNERKGQMLGMDLDDTVYVPVERTLAMFNRVGLAQIDVLFEPRADADAVQEALRRVLVARHGEEDFTIVQQRQMLATLGSVLDVLTFAVAALGGISLLVGSIGVLTVMLIAVRERVAEIGLLRALGAGSGQVLGLFLGEAVLLAGLGGLGGLAAGIGGTFLLGLLVPALPVQISPLYCGLAVAAACGIGLLAGAGPALRAARLDPIEALRAE